MLGQHALGLEDAVAPRSPRRRCPAPRGTGPAAGPCSGPGRRRARAPVRAKVTRPSLLPRRSRRPLRWQAAKLEVMVGGRPRLWAMSQGDAKNVTPSDSDEHEKAVAVAEQQQGDSRRRTSSFTPLRRKRGLGGHSACGERPCGAAVAASGTCAASSGAHAAGEHSGSRSAARRRAAPKAHERAGRTARRGAKPNARKT